MVDGSEGRSPNPVLLAAAAVVLLLFMLLGLTLCGGGGPSLIGGGPNVGKDTGQRYACPRPANWGAVQPGFNTQETEIRRLRRLAFQNDFFAQLELGRRYAKVRETDANIEDPIESAVWLTVALANGEGYAPINRAVRDGFWGAIRPVSRYDDCRAWERHAAYRTLNRMLGRMSTAEQQKVRDRVIYVLSTQGADGYRTLARLYDGFYGPFGEPADNEQAQEAAGRAPGENGYRNAVALFPRNDVDAYLYNYLAMQTGDVGAYVLLQDFQRSAPERANYGAFVEAKAARWVPPYEFYPPESPRSGVVYSDEARPRGDAYETALSRIYELPFKHVSDALLYLGAIQRPATADTGLAQGEIDSFKAMLGEQQGTRFTALDRVRAIQFAAVSGSAQAQLVLAVMYAEGVGVPADYARSFFWFSEAERQGSPEAKFAMSTYFALGVEGVADQDKAMAVVYRMDSALAGFKPTVSRIRAVLAQVSKASRRGGYAGPRNWYDGRRYDYGRTTIEPRPQPPSRPDGEGPIYAPRQ